MKQDKYHVHQVIIYMFIILVLTHVRRSAFNVCVNTVVSVLIRAEWRKKAETFLFDRL